VRSLSEAGFKCDEEDVGDGFHELEAWVFLDPPFNLTTHQAVIIAQVQRFVPAGMWKGYSALELQVYYSPLSVVPAWYGLDALPVPRLSVTS
jgi:hypothetical protein